MYAALLFIFKMLSLREWLENVETNWSPEEGLFTNDDPEFIANYLIRNSKDRTQALRRLIFYMNRAGENLTNRRVLNKAKNILMNK